MRNYVGLGEEKTKESDELTSRSAEENRANLKKPKRNERRKRRKLQKRFVEGGKKRTAYVL